jgi:uncharacterized membrane protein
VSHNELLDVVFRWAHVIAGIMWIGNSMLFNWLDRNLEKSGELARLSQGRIHLLHSGAFYDVEKKLLEPGELPATLHWFKWQNFTTWATGICLLVVVYYGNGAAFLVDPAVRDVGPTIAITLSASALLVAWIVYDGIWRSLGDAPRLATALSIAALFGSIYGFAHVFSGRAAFIQTGVVIGTIMTGNVWMVIVPSQRALVEATRTGKPQDAALSLAAKQRSIHNNYLTFPLLFVMVSNHFSAATTHWLNWLVLIVVFVGGAGVRHFMNARYLGAGRELATRAWLAPAVAMGAIAIAGLYGITRIDNTPRPGVDYAVPFSRVQEIVAVRCLPCHSKKPALTYPVQGVFFDTPDQIRVMAPRIRYRVYDIATMPFENKTLITKVERAELAAWVDSGALVR